MHESAIIKVTTLRAIDGKLKREVVEMDYLAQLKELVCMLPADSSIIAALHALLLEAGYIQKPFSGPPEEDNPAQ